MCTLYVIINFAKRAQEVWNAWPQSLRPILVTDKYMYHIYVKSSSLIKTNNRVIALFFIVIFFLNSIYWAERDFLFNEFNAKNGTKGLMNTNV
jgi:hypothetical protein